MSVHKVLLLLIGTIIHNGSIDAYVTSPALSLLVKGRGLEDCAMSNRVPRSNNLVRLFSGDHASSDDSSSSSNSINNPLDENSAPPSSPLFAEPDAPTTVAQKARFGDVTPISSRTSSSPAPAQFGDVVSIRKRSPEAPQATSVTTATTMKNTGQAALSDKELLRQRRMRNIGVAILSIFLAVGNYAYQWTHPVTPIQLLVNMERTSAPLSDIGKNSKPTVIDFWAPWCENCRYMAPTLLQVEESYKDKVNFVMVNGDDPNNWPLIEALGVDAIPHLAMVESDGTVDTALIGTVPKEWLSRDIDVLLANAKTKPQECDALEKNLVDMATASDSEKLCGKQKLPYQMLDVFANRNPEDRKLVNLDAIVGSARR